MHSNTQFLRRQKKARRRPTFPQRIAVSSARERLTSVFGMGTGITTLLWSPGIKTMLRRVKKNAKSKVCLSRKRQYGQASRTVSIARLNTSLCVHLRPINQMISLGPLGWLNHQGSLVLGRASRLDAFSGYPFRTQLPGSALGRTTGRPEVRPPRSSRTKGRAPQTSNARNR